MSHLRTGRVKASNPFDEETAESWSATVRNDIHTQPFNFSGSPTLSVPCGFSAEGLRLSVQFVGRRLSESSTPSLTAVDSDDARGPSRRCLRQS
jgi:Asp-tRNA(Asn)/Glu-tRNA(Gln) amidotransferase A subunit family amidase